VIQVNIQLESVRLHVVTSVLLELIPLQVHRRVRNVHRERILQLTVRLRVRIVIQVNIQLESVRLHVVTSVLLELIPLQVHRRVRVAPLEHIPVQHRLRRVRIVMLELIPRQSVQLHHLYAHLVHLERIPLAVQPHVRTVPLENILLGQTVRVYLFVNRVQ
jgi:hypothetical protein